ncbi:molybdenum cofactor guanylyltransferase [Glaciibacter sp. 2TAF33]|uniref:molybdenum cofactor guanylyltransferase n=1 Tax=Glaciibacter sp. 2TAF33 TaxID=3233015 RepID=UPI003F8E2EDD
MSFAAIILAGGRGSRLGGIDKPALLFQGRSLLQIAVDAANGSAMTVIVGPRGLPGVIAVQEEPRWGGPVAALAAGMSVIPESDAEVLVLAADHPRVDDAVRSLHRVMLGSADGIVALDAEGHRQPLLGRYRMDRLRGALDTLAAERGNAAGASLRELLAGLTLTESVLPDELCADIDTPADALRHGIEVPAREPDRLARSPLSTMGDRTDGRSQ